MGFVVNEDKPTNSARVHDESCRNYLHPQTKNPRDGGWIGPFKTKDEAFAEARAIGRSDVKGAACCLAESAMPDRAKGVIGSAKQGVKRAVEVMSGADIRRFEEFTDAVTTAVIGVHRDQAELREQTAHFEKLIDDLKQEQDRLTSRMAYLERSVQTRAEESKVAGLSPWVIAFGAISAVALLLSAIAIVVSVS